MRKSDQEAEPGSNDPSSPTEVGSRISAVVDLYQSRIKAAEAAGVSTDQLARYISGDSQPKLGAIARLADGVGVRLEWIWSGTGSQKSAPESRNEAAPAYGYIVERLIEQQLFMDLVESLVEVAESVLDERGMHVSPKQKAKIIRRATEIADRAGMSSGGGESTNMLVDVIEAVLRKGLDKED